MEMIIRLNNRYYKSVPHRSGNCTACDLHEYKTQGMEFSCPRSAHSKNPCGFSKTSQHEDIIFKEVPTW